MIYRIVVKESWDGFSSMRVSNGLLERWGITEEKLFEIARRFSVSPGQMLAANDLPEGTETLAAPRRLLIPGG